MARYSNYTVFVVGSKNRYNSFPGVIDQVEAVSREAAVADVLSRIEANGQCLSAVLTSQLTLTQRDEVQHWRETEALAASHR